MIRSLSRSLSTLAFALFSLLIMVSGVYAGGFTPPALEEFSAFRTADCGDPARWVESGRKLLQVHPQLVPAVVSRLEPFLDQSLKRELAQGQGVKPFDPAVDFNLVRATFKGLSCMGMALADQGRHSEALACIRSAVKLSIAVTRVSFGGPVSLINQMIGIAGINTSMLAVHRYIYQYAPDDQTIIALAREVDRLRKLKAPFAFSIEYEHKNMLKLIEHLKNDPSLIKRKKPLADSMVKQIKAYYDADVWKVFKKTMELSQQPFHQTDAGFKELKKEVDILIASTDVPWYKAWWDPAWAISRILVSICVPNFERAVHHDVRSDTLLAATGIAAGARLFQLRNRFWPETESDLPVISGLSYPADACSGQPWVFQRKGRGLRLYSTGWNRQDDGGKMEDKADDFNIFDAWGEK